MPHKHYADRRHHIPKMAFKVRNWPEYEAGPRRRGSLTLWIEDGALRHWQTLGPCGQARLAVDAANGMIIARTLTDQDVDDPSQVAPLLDQIDSEIAKVIADFAYDGAPTYATITAHGGDIVIVTPPRSTAVASGDQGPPTQSDCHLKMITEQGRLAWQKATYYGKRSLVETTMGRYKALIGPRLRARGFAARQTEAAIGVAVLNQMLVAGRPDSVRCLHVIE